MFVAQGKIKETVVIQMQKGEDVIACVKKVCEEKGITDGVILSAVGSLDGASYSDPIPDPTSKSGERGALLRFEGPLEVLCGGGEICHRDDGDIKVHMHLALADKDGVGFGGHMEDGGNIVLCTMNVVVGVLEGVDMGYAWDERIEKTILCPKNK